MQSDMTTSSSYSTSNTESELSDSNDNMEDDNDDLASEGLSSSVFHGINLLQPVSKAKKILQHLFVSFCIFSHCCFVCTCMYIVDLVCGPFST